MPDFPITPTDPTLNPSLRSFVEAANDSTSDFPIQNLPLCRFQRRDRAAEERHGPAIGVAIGDRVTDLDMMVHAGFMNDDPDIQTIHNVLHSGQVNFLLAQPVLWRRIRVALQAFLQPGHVGQQLRRLRDKAVIPMRDVTFLPPCNIGNYTDFYASVHHAKNVGSMFRPDNPLLPNYKHIPIGYHGRASSIVPSGFPVRRPAGQTNTDNAASPSFGPCKRLDYELEVGCIIGPHNNIGYPITIADAPQSIFGLVLVNDWSARDIQAWEYQPLGPFLAKNFLTTISPFALTIDALQPFRTTGPAREPGDPEPLPYLRGDPHSGFDINLEVHLQSKLMREKNLSPMRISRSNLKDMFWTFPQMIAHHTSGGCNLWPGDLLASGTVSGPSPDSRGCLLELTWQGNGPDGKPNPRKPLDLPSGEKRTFLEDGDTVTMTGWCQRDGYARIGFGECTGTVTAAPTEDEIRELKAAIEAESVRA